MMLKFSGETITGEDFIRRLVEYRFVLKKNTFIALVGAPGEGKSYTALRLAEIIQRSPRFVPERQIIYYPYHSLKSIKIAELKNYRVLILDEAHTTVSAHTWLHFVNKAISFVMSTFRQLKSLVVIIVTPNMKWIDKRIRELINFYGVVHRLTSSKAKLDLYSIKINYYYFNEQNPYLSRIHVLHRGRLLTVRRFLMNLPSQDLIERYEYISKLYKSKLLEYQIKELVTKMNKAETEALLKVEREVMEYLKERGLYIEEIDGADLEKIDKALKEKPPETRGRKKKTKQPETNAGDNIPAEFLEKLKMKIENEIDTENQTNIENAENDTSKNEITLTL